MYHIYLASCHKEGGVWHYLLDDQGRTSYLGKVKLDRPIYAAMDGQKFYVLLRQPFAGSAESGLLTYEITSDGELVNPGALLSTKGEVACHLTAKDGNVYVVNYLSGSVVKMPDKLVSHQGRSVHPKRQTSPHTHFVSYSPDGRYLLVADLGMDKILVYDQDLSLAATASVPPGQGARHLAFSEDGKTVFCVNELGSTVSVFSYAGGKLSLKDTYRALPQGYAGENTAAAIRTAGDFLYVSNRGQDAISCFKIAGGKLAMFDSVSCGGRSPRDFNITPDGRYLLCANELSDTVTCFARENGRLQRLAGEIQLPAPLCVLFRPV